MRSHRRRRCAWRLLLVVMGLVSRYGGILMRASRRVLFALFCGAMAACSTIAGVSGDYSQVHSSDSGAIADSGGAGGVQGVAGGDNGGSGGADSGSSVADAGTDADGSIVDAGISTDAAIDAPHDAAVEAWPPPPTDCMPWHGTGPYTCKSNEQLYYNESLYDNPAYVDYCGKDPHCRFMGLQSRTNQIPYWCCAVSP